MICTNKPKIIISPTPKSNDWIVRFINYNNIISIIKNDIEILRKINVKEFKGIF